MKSKMRLSFMLKLLKQGIWKELKNYENNKKKTEKYEFSKKVNE